MNDQTESPAIGADELVARYLELRNYVQDQDRLHKDRMKPYTEAMQVLEGMADLLMKQTGQKALSTVHGTAFYNHTMSVTCSDREAFLNFVFSTNARQFLTAHVAKEAVQMYMEGSTDGRPPPGVEINPVIRVNFRKS